MKFVLVLILTMSGGKEIARTPVKYFDDLGSCRIYAMNHADLNTVIAGHPPKVQKTDCTKVSP